MQGELADVWKENVLEDLKEEALEYESVGKFLAAIKKERIWRRGGRVSKSSRIEEIGARRKDN